LPKISGGFWHKQAIVRLGILVVQSIPDFLVERSNNMAWFNQPRRRDTSPSGNVNTSVAGEGRHPTGPDN
jgi:hypothetical protein